MSATTLHRRDTTRNSLVGLGGAAVSGLFGFLLAVVLARGFGPAGSGAVFAAVGLLTVVSAVSCLGADTGLIWALPRRPANPGGLLSVALLPPLAAALALAAAGLLLIRPLAATFHLGPGLVTVALIAVPLTVVMTILLSAVRASRPIAAYAAVQFGLLPVGRPILVGAVALASGGVVAALAGWVLPAVAAVAACLFLLPFPARPPSPGDWRMFWSFALPRAVSAAIDSGSMWIGVLLTAALATQADAGVFGGVGRYVLAGQLAMQGLRVAVAPQLSGLLGAGRGREAAVVHRQATVWSVVLCWPVYLLLAIFAPAFLALFGGEFLGGADAMAILSAAMLVNVGLGTVQTLLLMSGRSRAHLAATAAGLACTVGFGLWWIPALGLTGAAAAWGTGIVVENVLAAVAARAVIGSAVLSRSAVVAAAAVAATVGSAGAAAVAVAGRGLTGLLIAAGLLSCAAAAALTRPRVRGRIADLRPPRGGTS